jgi:hypothetical protein
MAFIQPGWPWGARIRLNGETVAAGARSGTQIRARGESSPRITRRGAWKVGGLVGAVVYSAVCWMLVYHGTKTVIAWMKPEPQIEASVVAAAPAEDR